MNDEIIRITANIITEKRFRKRNDLGDIVVEIRIKVRYLGVSYACEYLITPETYKDKKALASKINEFAGQIIKKCINHKNGTE